MRQNLHKAVIEALDTSDLTFMQRRFVAEYLDCLNGAKAARRAGYSARCARQQAYENHAKPQIRAIIDLSRDLDEQAFEAEMEERIRRNECKVVFNRRTGRMRVVHPYLTNVEKS